MIARFTGAEPGANARALILKLQQALEQAEENAKQLGTLSVKVVQLMEDAEPTAQVQYTEDEIIIHLGIPAGKTGDKGAQGNSGVYVGSGEMPEGYNVQIDPDGEVEPFPAALVLSALPEASEALRGSFAIAPEGNNDKLYICMKL